MFFTAIRVPLLAVFMVSSRSYDASVPALLAVTRVTPRCDSRHDVTMRVYFGCLSRMAGNLRAFVACKTPDASGKQSFRGSQWLPGRAYTQFLRVSTFRV